MGGGDVKRNGVVAKARKDGQPFSMPRRNHDISTALTLW
jgi:hypothetical protein